MNNRIKNKKQKVSEIEWIERDINELKQSRTLITSILENIIENQSISSELKYDMNYIVLKTAMGRELVDSYVLEVEENYLKQNIVPSLEDFHEEVLKRVVNPYVEKEDYPIQVSIQLLKEFSTLNVSKEILKQMKK